jgi:hypothetical protein
MAQILYVTALVLLGSAGYSLLQAPQWELSLPMLLCSAGVAFVLGIWLERKNRSDDIIIGKVVAWIGLSIVAVTGYFYAFAGSEIDLRVYEASHADSGWIVLGNEVGKTPTGTQAVSVYLLRKRDAVRTHKIAVFNRRGFSIDSVAVSEVWTPGIVRSGALKEPVFIKGEGVSWGSTIPELFTPKAGFVEREFQFDSLVTNLQLAVVVQYYSIQRGGWPIERFQNVAGMLHARFKIPE